MTSVAAVERAALLDLLERLGPDAPTLCEGWRTHDLAAHLVARERRPKALVGIVVKPLNGLAQSAEAVERRRPYRELLQVLRGGPPRWSIGGMLRGPLSGSTDVHELFVHHEDVRRLVDPAPRQAGPELDAALWKRVKVMGRFLAHEVPVSVDVRTPDGREAQVKGGSDPVVLRGTPGELLLFLFGRRSVAQVEVEGSDAARQAVMTAPLGI